MIGLGDVWRLGARTELHLGSIFVTGFAQLGVRFGDGTEANFDIGSGGIVTPHSLVPRNDVRVEFLGYGPTFAVGVWPSDWSTLARSVASRWRVTTSDGTATTLETYLDIDGDGTYRVARPIEIKDANGYRWTYAYDASGEMSSITDSFNRRLTFQWQFGTFDSFVNRPVAINLVTLPDNTKVRYQYSTATDGAAFTPSSALLSRVEWLSTTNVVLRSELYHYEDARHQGALTGITDARGVRIKTIAYNADRQVVAVRDAAGQLIESLTYTDTADAMITRSVNGLGRPTVYTFQRETPNGLSVRLTSVNGEATTNCAASNSTYAYGSNGAIERATDAEGRVTAYVRDTRGRPTRITEAEGRPEQRVTTITWHPTLDRPTRVTTPGLRVDYTWSTTGRLDRKVETDTTTNPAPNATGGQTRTWVYTYTATGKPATVDGPLTGTVDQTRWTWAASGALASVTEPLGFVTTVVSSNARGQPTRVTNPAGYVVDYAYDALGRLTRITEEPGTGQSVWTFAYDAAGNVTRLTRPDGGRLDYAWNTIGRLTTITNAAGERMSLTYDVMGNVTRSETRLTATATPDRLERFTHDELGRLLTVLGVGDRSWRMGYDRVDNLISSRNPRGHTETLGYDALDRLIRATDGAGGVTTLALTGNGDVRTHTDPTGRVTTYVRNGWGEVVQETSPDTGVTRVTRDADGRPITILTATGHTIAQTFDARDRLTQRTISTGTTVAETQTFGYDSTLGGNFGQTRLTSVTYAGGSLAIGYDRRGRVVSTTRVIGTRSYSVGYGYDLTGRLASMTYPSGRLVSFIRDTHGRITSVTSRPSATAADIFVASAISWPSLSEVSPSGPRAITFGNGTQQTFTRDQDQRLTALSVTAGATALLSWSLGYPDLLNLGAITDLQTAALSQSFGYDAAGRMTQATGPWGRSTYQYNAAGHRTAESLFTAANALQWTDTYTLASGRNHLTSVTRAGVTTRLLAWDAAGHAISDTRSGTAYTYGRDHLRRLTSIAVGGQQRVSFAYDPGNLMVSRTRVNQTVNGATHFIHDLFGNVIAEAAPTGLTQREYIYLPEGLETPAAPTAGRPLGQPGLSRPLAAFDGTGASAQFLSIHTDQVLRPVLMTDATAAVAWRARFRPFGELISVTGPKSLDARFPGQWFQFEAGLHANWHRTYDPTLGRYLEADPLGFPDGPNRYAYVGSSPLMFVDPEGRQAIIVGPRPIPIPIPTPGITPRPLPILPPTRGRPQAGEDCVEELNECDKLCQRASCDPDMKSVWYGSWSKCIRGCLSARCGGNRGTVY